MARDDGFDPKKGWASCCPVSCRVFVISREWQVVKHSPLPWNMFCLVVWSDWSPTLRCILIVFPPSSWPGCWLLLPSECQGRITPYATGVPNHRSLGTGFSQLTDLLDSYVQILTVATRKPNGLVDGCRNLADIPQPTGSLVPIVCLFQYDTQLKSLAQSLIGNTRIV